MGALKDCEAFTTGLVGQPVNTVTCLAFVIGGAIIWMRSRRRVVAVGMVATGVGSILFHGPRPPYAQLAHDVTLWFLVAAVLVSIVVDLRRGEPWRPLMGPAVLLGTAAVVGRLGAPPVRSELDLADTRLVAHRSSDCRYLVGPAAARSNERLGPWTRKGPKKAVAGASALLGLPGHSPGKRAPGWVTFQSRLATAPSPTEVALIR